ncbi:putative signal peptidase I [Blattamonas nauphoetae]|uniref:Signal peptidase complex catalytic subunit SEC11 n=1 Tax=Blattamonas nauphoetae TaxID=2049346 RepID=A0ABQ9XKF8_9EUKA|nr:putative signal peptidase I [Blattamonas nauphoetae]
MPENKKDSSRSRTPASKRDPSPKKVPNQSPKSETKQKGEKGKDKSKSKKNAKKLGFWKSFKNAMTSDMKSDLIILAIFGLMVVGLKTYYPISVVVSGSMEPVMYRGDFVLASGRKAPNYEKGDIVMWRINKSPIIVHRIIEVTEDGHYLTKGDNNALDDIGLYAKYGHPNPSDGITNDNIKGRVLYHVPKVGYPVMLAKENMIVAVIITLLWDLLYHNVIRRKPFELGRFAYNIISTISMLQLSQFLTH